MTARLAGLVQVLAQVGGTDDLHTALQVLAKGAVALLGGDQGAIRVYDAEGPGSHLAYWVKPDGSLEAAPHPEPPPGSVAAALRDGGPAQLIDDLWTLDLGVSPLYGELRKRGMRSSVAVPILAAPSVEAADGSSRQRIGSLHVDHRDVGRFDGQDLALAEALAAQAGAAIDRARLSAARQRAADAERERIKLDAALLVARTVAHELNNALAPVGGYADLLALSPAVSGDPALASYAQRIQEATEAAAERIRLLNGIVRLEQDASCLGPDRPLLNLERSAGHPG
jgi:GAF domain-containing protein